MRRAITRILNGRAALLALAALSFASVGGCANVGGYTMGEQFDTSIRSIAVPIFANKSFDREVEFMLTEALTKEIEARTPYKVTEAGGADTMLTGTILSVERRLLSRNFDTGVAQEVQVRVAASFEWKDLRSGEILRQRSRFVGTAEHVATYPANEPVEVAVIGAVDELAREIVSVMRADW